MENRRLDPHQLIRLVRRWTPLVLLFVLGGAGLAYLIGSRTTPIYEASGLLRVVRSVQIGSQSTTTAPDVTQTDAVLITEDDLLNKVSADLHLGSSAAQLRSQVNAVPGPSTELITVGVQDPNPGRAALIANAVMSEYTAEVSSQAQQAIDQASASLQTEIQSVEQSLQQENQQLSTGQRAAQDTTAVQRQIQADTQTLTQLTQNYSAFRAQQALDFEHVTVAAPAAVPTASINQRRLLDAAIGATAGLLIGTALAVLLQLLDQGVRTEADVREKLGVPVLGVIPKFEPGTGAEAERGASAAAEAYRRLRTNLQFTSVDEPLTSVVITSARVGEGKSRTAANLAGVIAASGTGVLLVDADMRHPTQHRIFERNMQGGMSEMLLGMATRGDAPELNGNLKTKFSNLSLLTAGMVPPNPAELLASRAAENTMRGLQHEFEMVIIDTPPVDVVTDALSLAAKASGTVLVVESGSGDARQLRHTIERLNAVGAHVIGVVLNKSRKEPASEYYEYYTSPTAAAEHSNGRLDDGVGVWAPVSGMTRIK